MMIGSSSLIFIIFNLGLEFEFCKWNSLSLRELYFLIGWPDLTELIGVKWTSRYWSLNKKIKIKKTSNQIIVGEKERIRF
jgi:uncharacterized membrane protein